MNISPKPIQKDSLQHNGILTLLILFSEMVFDNCNLYKGFGFSLVWHMKAEIFFYGLSQHFVNFTYSADCDYKYF